MQKAIFWHMYLKNDWKRIVTEQMNVLASSGLLSKADYVFCGVVCSKHYAKLIKIFIRNAFQQATKKIQTKTFDQLFKVCTTMENHYEHFTLNALREYGLNNDAYVLYMHTKGSSIPIKDVRKKYKEEWRIYMEYFLVKGWENCISKLEENDCCGVNYCCRRGTKMFAGNFWWATSNYIKKTIPIKIKGRMYYERWLSYGNPNAKFFGLFNNAIRKREKRYLPQNYITQSG